jgi:tryptophan synthase alpha chain
MASRITKKFKKLRAAGRKAFIPYIMAGAPSLKRTKELIKILEDCGADIIELGVPFTDPLADGPVIQRAAEMAISRGVVLKDVIALVREVREWTNIPIILMTYYNPVFKYGDERFMQDASDAGVDGVIVPDLPPDEAGGLMKSAKKHGVDTIFLLAPTSTDERRKIVAKASSGFIYYVSLKRAIADTMSVSGGKPVALGFGVSTRDEARTVAELADGVIVGSAIVRRTEEVDLEDFLRGLRRAIG